MLAKLFASRSRARAPLPSLPPGQRVYAVGDVHGCLELLDALLTRIEADNRARGEAETSIVFLGDLVDRGPDSAGVVQRIIDLGRGGMPVRCLLGNHEEVFLLALAGDAKALRLFCRIGGRETALSYGIAPDDYERADYRELAQLLGAHVPDEHRRFLESFEDMIVLGDYAFVHAGVDPRAGAGEQKQSDLRWIRERFLDHTGAWEKLVVHGHTISEAVEYRPHRIGIDTGAFSTGRLTALGLEGTDRWELRSGTAASTA